MLHSVFLACKEFARRHFTVHISSSSSNVHFNRDFCDSKMFEWYDFEFPKNAKRNQYKCFIFVYSNSKKRSLNALIIWYMIQLEICVVNLCRDFLSWRFSTILKKLTSPSLTHLSEEVSNDKSLNTSLTRVESASSVEELKYTSYDCRWMMLLWSRYFSVQWNSIECRVTKSGEQIFWSRRQFQLKILVKCYVFSYCISSNKRRVSDKSRPLISAAPLGIHIEISASL